MKPLPLFNTILRLLTFRATREELERLDLRFLGVGMVGTWLVGIGRYWDSPTASFAQKTGIGSVVYVFILSAILWIVAKPLRPSEWSYPRVLTFITLTSFPAALYALPVERWTDISTAITLNVWFLSVVALYRVALYLFFMARGADLGPLPAIVAVMLPITVIIATIVVSGYTGIVFDMMGGFRDRQPTAQDGVNAILTGIIGFGCCGAPFWAVVYGVLIRYRDRPDTV
ncbi:hypothetical protein EON82_03165 [bacterium]|nr:MAG: hypothetical protein EON82_03165 [bacterium]